MSEKSAPSDRALSGPFDASEVSPVQPFIDLGAIRIKPRQGMQLRLDIEQSNKKLISATLELSGSTIQLHAFAAPKNEGVWDDIRVGIAEQIDKQGGSVDQIVGPFGPEIAAHIPAGSGKKRRVRFIGVDGPTWFLRGVITGQAAENPRNAAEIEDVFRTAVVDRGNAPLPPRELLQLKVPPQPGMEQ